MKYIYLLINDGVDWEDTKIFLTEQDAIQASIKYKSFRVEIFGKGKDAAYIPTYNYYLDGKLYLCSEK